MNLFETKSYSFELPEDLIAATPLLKRDEARLLVVHKRSRKIEHKQVSDLPQLLPKNTAIVANNTKVFPARLLGSREGTGGNVEFFMLKKLAPDTWQGLMKAGAKIAPGFKFVIKHIHAEVIAREDTPEGAFFTARFSEDPADAKVGEVPLPPYIVAKRAELKTEQTQKNELETYNTTFARKEGSVAAPTAGRHFTPELISALRAAGHSWNEITLHVGLGTFKPVGTKDIREHTMHAELSTIDEKTAGVVNQAKKNKQTILAIGTTSVRTLEGRASSLSTEKSFEVTSGTKDVNLFIHPGANYHFKMVDAILTNFHLPESTLFMMIASFIGDLEFTHQIYKEAIEHRYRFYSYGDAMLILD